MPGLRFNGVSDLWSSDFDYITIDDEQLYEFGKAEILGYSDYGFFNPFEEALILQPGDQIQSIAGNEIVHDLLLYDIISPPIVEGLDKIIEIGEVSNVVVVDVDDSSKEKDNNQCVLESLDLLKRFGSGIKRFKRERSVDSMGESIGSSKNSNLRLTAEEITRVASQRFSETHFDYSLSGFSKEEIEDLELVNFLLTSAHKLSKKEYECVTGYLDNCDLLSSKTGNVVQRVVHYFTQALRENLDQVLNGSTKTLLFDYVNETTQSDACLSQHIEVPFGQIEQFAGIQAIVENMVDSKRIHIIDLCTRHGTQWAILLQALASRHECPIELLKITTVCTSSKTMEAEGKRLANMAKSLNRPFSFKIVLVPDIIDLQKDLLEINEGESIAVYSFFFAWTLISQPDRLQSLMGVIKKIHPSIMVVTEVEANLNQSAFTSRFSEALSFYLAYYDCLASCMVKNVEHRIIIESMFGRGIKNVLAAGEGERTVRHVKIDVWRSFFSRFRMVEKSLSMSSLKQAELMTKNFACGSSCTLDMNRKSLLLGWNGTPLHSLSVWKFLG